jgi:hypothetical protein
MHGRLLSILTEGKCCESLIRFKSEVLEALKRLASTDDEIEITITRHMCVAGRSAVYGKLLDWNNATEAELDHFKEVRVKLSIHP